MNGRVRMALVSVGVLLTLFGAAGCGSKAGRPVVGTTWDEVLAKAKEEGSVVWYSSGVQTVEQQLIAEFEKETGIKVEYSRPGGGEVVVKKLETEEQANQHIADVLTLTDRTLSLYLQEKKLTQPLEVPNVTNIHKSFQDPKNHPVSLAGVGMVIVYNTDLVKPADAPKSYKDLADPRWKDKITLGGPENAGTTTLWIKAMVEQYGWEYVESLRANGLTETRLQTESVQAVARGEKAVTVVASAWGFSFWKQKAPIAVVWPEDGAVIADVNAVVTSNAPHPNAARVLINWLLSRTFQDAMGSAMGTYPVTTDAAPPPAEIFPALNSLKIYQVDLPDLVKNRGPLLEKWRAIMG